MSTGLVEAADLKANPIVSLIFFLKSHTLCWKAFLTVKVKIEKNLFLFTYLLDICKSKRLEFSYAEYHSANYRELPYRYSVAYRS